MRTITIEVPDWAEERHIRVFAGLELLAYAPFGGEVHVKAARCNQCGYCCEAYRPGCGHLVRAGDKRFCGLGMQRPFDCCSSDPVLNKTGDEDRCSIRYVRY